MAPSGGLNPKGGSSPHNPNLLGSRRIVNAMPQADGPPTDEAHAIERLRRGDIGGLETLVRRYQLQATRAAYLVVRDRQLAEDIVCDAFLRCNERIHQFHTDRPFGPWFLRAVVNDALKAADRRARQVSLSRSTVNGSSFAELLASPDPGPDVLAEFAELRHQVQEALERLTPRQRSAIVLHYFVGLSGPEIADELSRPLGTVKRRLHDGRSRLRTLLAGMR
jgi:RNA polymerase sigma-70 factor (ECF subfamily)